MAFHIGYFGCPTTENVSSLNSKEVQFLASDWRNKNFLRIIQSGTPANNEVGPHGLPVGGYIVSIYQNEGNVDLKHILADILIDRTTGIITIWKASRTPAFSGRAEIVLC